MHLVHAAEVVCRKVLESSFTFNGSFSECNSVPQSLLALVNMILEGPNIKHHSTNIMKTATAFSQLLIFNSMKYARDADPATTIHSPCTSAGNTTSTVYCYEDSCYHTQKDSYQHTFSLGFGCFLWQALESLPGSWEIIQALESLSTVAARMGAVGDASV